MDSTLVQHWQAVYLCAALLFAAATTAAGDHLREGGPPAMPTRCTVAMVTGALWPVVLVGLAQLMTINGLLRHLRAKGAPPAVAPEQLLASASAL
jgi:hypothetical protein